MATYQQTLRDITATKERLQALESLLEEKKAERGIALAKAISYKLSSRRFADLMSDLNLDPKEFGYDKAGYPHNAFASDLTLAIERLEAS